MTQEIDIRSGDLAFGAVLDFDTMRWTAEAVPPEADFPLAAHVAGKRYELYSDRTFAEVEGGLA